MTDSKKLASRYGLSFRRESCLAARSSPRACSRCAEACPARALSVSERGVDLAHGCLGCGCCVAACPSGALSAQGYRIPDRLLEGNHALTVECWKVPPPLLAEGAHAVPCLGGLTAADLLELVLAAGEGRSLVLMDRGGCASCRAGGQAQPPVATQLEFVRHALTQLGWPQQGLPALRCVPLPSPILPVEIPTPAEREAMGRRAFFRFLAGKAAEAATLEPPPCGSVRHGARHGEQPFPERIRLLAALEKLAALRSIPLPDGLFPAVSVSGNCQNHGVCAGVCPTGALTGYKETEGAGVRFEPWLCVGCGLCARSCPEGALDLSPVYGLGPSARIRLTRFPWRECPSCQTRFPSRDEGICPGCKRSRSLFDDLFGGKNHP